MICDARGSVWHLLMRAEVVQIRSFLAAFLLGPGKEEFMLSKLACPCHCRIGEVVAGVDICC